MIDPSHLLNENGDLSYLLYFSKQCLVDNIQGRFKIAFASTGDCLELFASEGDFVTPTLDSFYFVTSMAGD